MEKAVFPELVQPSSQGFPNKKSWWFAVGNVDALLSLLSLLVLRNQSPSDGKAVQSCLPSIIFQMIADGSRLDSGLFANLLKFPAEASEKCRAGLQCRAAH